MDDTERVTQLKQALLVLIKEANKQALIKELIDKKGNYLLADSILVDMTRQAKVVLNLIGD